MSRKEGGTRDISKEDAIIFKLIWKSMPSAVIITAD